AGPPAPAPDGGHCGRTRFGVNVALDVSVDPRCPRREGVPLAATSAGPARACSCGGTPQLRGVRGPRTGSRERHPFPPPRLRHPNEEKVKMETLIAKTRRHEARCGIIGLGYVGLPLALEFARAGFRVTGIDLDRKKVADIMAGRSYIVDVADAEIA